MMQINSSINLRVKVPIGLLWGAFLTLGWLLFASTSASAQATCSQPFFSEYIEGSSTNKGLEIFNPSDQPVSLEGYSVLVFVNGGTDPRFTLELTGTLDARSTFFIANSSADFAESADITASVAGFNGDDAVILVDSEGNTIDAIGIVGEDPGTGWTVGDGSTANFTLVRNPDVGAGTANWTTGASQWTVLAQDDFTNIGLHEFDTTICEAGSAEGLSIVINEFQSADTDQIELKNYSSETLDISDWWLCARFVYTQISDASLTITGNTVMEPGDIITITGFGLDDTSSDIGLYEVNSFANPEAMVAFVQYGAAGIGRENVAADAGIWTAGDFISELPAGSSAEFIGMPASGTQLLASGDYVIQDNPTFGSENDLVCTADAGSLTGITIAEGDCEDGIVTLAAEPNGDAVIPDGYEVAFVLTKGENLLIEGISIEPSFIVQEDGLYTIHSLVFNPNPESPDFFDPIEFASQLEDPSAADFLDLIIENDICAALDVAGAFFDVVCNPEIPCDADAGTLSPDPLGDPDCYDPNGGSAVIFSATPNEDAVVPEGYSVAYLVTFGEEMVYLGWGEAPAFEVDGSGLFTIHTLVYAGNPEMGDFFDVNALPIFEITGNEILDLIKEQGICASLDITGAQFLIEECVEVPCDADAGSLTPVETDACLDSLNSMVTISATPNGDEVVPEGYVVGYVLTTGLDLIIQDIGVSPEFTVVDPGLYTIHTLVFDFNDTSANYLDLSELEFGKTTGAEVLALIEASEVCASLDEVGASFEVESCEPTTPVAPNCVFFSEYVEGSSSNKALELYNACDEAIDLSNYQILTFVNGDTDPRFEFIPQGILSPGEVIVICNGGVDFPDACDTTASITGFNGDDAIALVNLTTGDTLDIIGVIGEDPGTEWEVDNGTTANHTLIRKSFVTQGNTDWTSAQEEWFSVGEDVSDSLGTHPHSIEEPVDTTCTADAGTLTPIEVSSDNCLEGDSSFVTIAAEPNGDAVVPEGYAAFYLLTAGPDQILFDSNIEPSFEIPIPGLFTIHTLVLNVENESDFALVDTSLVLGESTAEDLVNLIDSSGICASFDQAGASFIVEPCTECEADAGSLTANVLTEEDCIGPDNPSVFLAAVPNGDAVVPEGSIIGYVLTQGTDLELVAADTVPEFTVSEVGLYTIHTVVIDTTSEVIADLDTASIEEIIASFENAGDVIEFLLTVGICADIDVEGATFEVPACPGCDASAGTMTASTEVPCYEGSQISLIAAPAGDAVIPDGYTQLFVLTQGEELTLLRVNEEPTFDIAETGIFTIHSLVFIDDETDPEYLDLSSLEPGTSTGVDVLNLIDSLSVCASLDVEGARFTVETCGGGEGECPEVCTLSNWNGNLGGPDYTRPLNMAMVLHISPLDPYLMNGDYSNYQRFVWETHGTLTREENRITISGTVVSKVDSAAKFELELILVGKESWEDFSQRSDAAVIPASGTGDAYLDWEYWYFSEESKITGSGSLEGIDLSIYHTPKDSSRAVQIGVGANAFDLDEGIGGWFGYTGVFNGEEFKAMGDIAVDIDGCTKADTCGDDVFAPTSVIDDRELHTRQLITNRFTVFPNPSERFVNVRDSQPQKGTYTFTVFDLNGRVIQEKKVKNFNGNYLLDASKFPNNVHVLQVLSPNGERSIMRFSIK